MLLPAKAAMTQSASRWRERLVALALAHRIALGTLFLAICGGKFSFGLDYVVDLRLGDETKYLGLATGYLPGPLLPEWSPLYVYFYRFEHLFASDPVALFFLHQKILATLLPIGFFLFLTARAVPFVVALTGAAYLLISVADLPVGPKTLHLALALMLLALAGFVRLGDNPARWGLLVASAGVLSLIRAEYLIPLGGITAYALYLAFDRGRPNGRALAWLAAGWLAVVALFAGLGSPLFGGRGMFAFAQHFALNYAAWQKLNQDPWTADYDAIFHQAFGNAQSIPAAFLANPLALLHHVSANLMHAPIVVAGLFFGHFNLFLPRFERFTLIEAGLFALLAAAFFGYRLRQSAALGGGGPTLVDRVRAAAPDTICLWIFLVPFVLMIALLYPRYHYALACGLILLTLALVLATPYLRGLELGGRAFLVFPILLAIVPSVGSAGARVDAKLGEFALEPRPALATIRYLRGLHIQEKVVICQSQEPGVGAYVGANYAEIEEEQKTAGFDDFLTTRHISIIVATDRMRRDPRFAGDPQWRRFQADPAGFGFAEHVLHDEGIVIYVRRELLPARPPTAS